MSEIVWPPLTTIRLPIKYFAERAVHLLFDTEAMPAAEHRYETVNHDLIARESTAPPNKFRTA